MNVHYECERLIDRPREGVDQDAEDSRLKKRHALGDREGNGSAQFGNGKKSEEGCEPEVLQVHRQSIPAFSGFGKAGDFIRGRNPVRDL